MMYCIAIGAFAASSAASVFASAISSAAGTTRLTRPICSASSRRDLTSGQQQIERDALADQPRQPLRAAVAGNDAEVDLRLAEPRRVGRDAQRARHRQLAAAAEREAVDRGDHRLAHVLDQIEDVLAAQRVLLALRRALRRPAR